MSLVVWSCVVECEEKVQAREGGRRGPMRCEYQARNGDQCEQDVPPRVIECAGGVVIEQQDAYCQEHADRWHIGTAILRESRVVAGETVCHNRWLAKPRAVHCWHPAHPPESKDLWCCMCWAIQPDPLVAVAKAGGA